MALRCAAALLSLALVALAGCQASARIESAEVVPVRQAGEVQALEFRSQFTVRNMSAASQVLYQVLPVDAGGRPLRSRDGRFQNPDGYVAAGTSYYIPTDHFLVDAARVRLPIEQLEADPARPVRGARFQVLDPRGGVLAEEIVPVSLRASDAWASAAGASGAPGDDEAAQPSPEAEEPRFAQSGAERRGARESRPGGFDAEVPSPEDELREYQAGRGGVPPEGEAAPQNAPPAEPSAEQERVALQRAHAGEVEPVDAAPAPEPAPPLEETPPRPVATDAPTPRPAAEDEAQRPVEPEVVPAPEPAPPAPVERPIITPAPSQEGAPDYFEYLVRRGDSLPRLAERFLGDSERWPDIYALNESRLYSPHVLPVGTALKIPRR